jgi:hypothetical protein
MVSRPSVTASSMALRRNERLFLVVFSFVFRLAIQFLGPLASVLTRGVYAELTAPTGIFHNR